MKRTICILFCLVFLACQPTPETDVVINKADGRLERTIESTAVMTYEVDVPEGEPTAAPNGAPEEPAPRNTLSESLGAPDRCTDSAEGKVFGGVLKITVDATVEVPNVSAVPVYTVRTRVFSAAEKERMVRMLLGDGPYYNLNREKLQKDMERTSIEDCTQQIANCDDRVFGENFDYDGYRFAAEFNLKTHLKNYAEMPEPGPMQPWTGSFADERVQVADAQNNFAGFGDGRMYLYDSCANSASSFDVHAPRFAREEQAMEIAAAWFERLTGDTVTAYGVAGDEDTFYSVTLGRGNEDYGAKQLSVGLMRTVAGIPVYPYRAYHGSDTGQQAAGFERDYDAPIHAEDIAVLVSDGVVIAVNWNDAFAVIGTENENVALLPFSQILESFKKQIFRSVYFDPSENGEENVICMVVERIVLSYMRVKKPNGNGEAYLLPVWDFMGYDYNPKYDRDLTGTKIWFSHQSLLTVNAIDGSIIDRDAGY